MVKKAILLFTAAACLSGAANAQLHCFTDEVHKRLKEKDPQVAVLEARLKAEIDAQLSGMNLSKLKVTAGDEDTAWKDKRILHVPVVFHIVHNYGQEYVSDNAVYTALKEINQMYSNTNPDTSDIIPMYKGNIPGTSIKYASNTHIQFHLATKDPNGMPTHGITRRYHYSSEDAGDHAKFDLWPRQSYLNIWIIKAFDDSHTGAAAYALKPSGAHNNPWYDGVIGTLQQGNINYDNTLAHEIGHSLNLDHPWGATNSPEVACGDDDVDDTPPTKGHSPASCQALDKIYDYACNLTDSIVGKKKLNVATAVADNQNGVGIKFKAYQKVNLDSLTIYPRDSGKAFQIVLKNGNNIVGSYTGITANNKINTTFGQIVPNNDTLANHTVDSLVGVGIRFKTYDSVFIKSVRFFTPSTSVNQPYEIVLKRNNTVVSTYSDIVDNVSKVANVNFAVPFIDTIGEYTIEFSVNPGTKRKAKLATLNAPALGSIRFTSDTAQGKYNYFYNWNIQVFNYAQSVPVRFVATVDTVNGYSLEFSNNPTAKRDAGSAITDTNVVTHIPNAIRFTADASQGMYNYFYRWVIRYGDYFQVYSPIAAKLLFNIPSTPGLSTTAVTINYPDTTNAQNVMDYTYCSKMFTYLQGVRMREALRNNIAFRNNLIDSSNLVLTGVLDANGSMAAWPDLPPVADYSIIKKSDGPLVFTCRGSSGVGITFTNRSWNDTVSSVQWTFSNNATPAPTSTNMNSVVNKFNTTGWVTVNLIANSNAGSDTIENTRAVYIADENSTSAESYFQEFDSATENDRYPTFNYYNNDSKWEFVNNAGYLDNTSIRYKQYDNRTSVPAILTGTPRGDFDDFFTPAFDLSQIGSGNLYLTFFSAGCFRVSNSTYMTDIFEVSYSTNCGDSWQTLKTITKGGIGNNGVKPLTEYTPGGFWEWQGQNIQLPTAVKTSNRVFFRFRFKPGVDPSTLIGTGNNFYIDRIHVSKWTTDVSSLEDKKSGITLAPNPTTGSTSVIIKDASSTSAQIIVTDVTGKLVYSTEASLNSNINRIEIPANYITVKGMYLVQVITGSNKQTEKLIVY